jgi:predicted phage baseplate assembly protein
MALPVPNLDDRTFQDIVNEARRRIPLYCPEWTDHNLSDPGITLIELFAWMTELTLYRLNKVTDKNYVKFLELIGVALAPAAPAATEVTFMLSAAQPNAVSIPQGTEVATVRTETEDAIIFTTTEELTIHPASLEHLLVTADGSRFDDRLTILREWARLAGLPGEEGRRVSLFQDAPWPGNAFYLGFNTDLRRSVLSVTLDCAERAAPGIVPSNPPLVWEYWDTELRAWAPFQRQPDSSAWLEQDGTRGLNTRGDVILHIPRTAGETSVSLREAFWIRCTVTPGTPETGAYEASPQLGSVVAATIGGVALASNVTRVVGEVLGPSNGKPGQTMRVSQVPMLPLEPGETVDVQREDDGGWEPWQQVADFSRSGPNDKHFVCDPVTGEIAFGPAIRSPNGEERRYGATPPAGMQVRLSSYRYGGGPKGNVGPGALSTLKSSIPYVASVGNRRVASGGVDPESIESAKMRGPQALRTLDRAVTEEDFEHLAREASPSVRRAKCLQPREVGNQGDPLPGVVRVLLVPTLPSSASRTVAPEDLKLSRELVEQVEGYLDQRRLLTTVLVVSEPEYAWVSVDARVRAKQGADSEQVRRAVEERLYRFIHPIHGGVDGEGWPFGRNLFVYELYSQIQPVPGVEYVEDVKVYKVDPATGRRGDAVQTLLIPRASLLCSATHTVTCT